MTNPYRICLPVPEGFFGYEVYKRLALPETDKQQKKENEERDYGQMAELSDGG